MGDTLTMETLMDVARALGPIRPRQRLIVGFPLVGDDEFVRHEARGLWLAGRLAWQRFEQVAVRESVSEPAAVTTLMGIPVEEYDPVQHGALVKELALDLIRHGSARLSELRPNVEGQP